MHGGLIISIIVLRDLPVTCVLICPLPHVHMHREFLKKRRKVLKSIIYVINHANFQLYDEYSDLYLEKLTIEGKYINKQI